MNFVNRCENITDAFASYYTTTLLFSSVTPTVIYDPEAKIDASFRRREAERMNEADKNFDNVADIVDKVQKSMILHIGFIGIMPILRFKAHNQTNRTTVLDQLLDLCGDIRFLELFKKLCRHVYCCYPHLVADYITFSQYEAEGYEN